MSKTTANVSYVRYKLRIGHQYLNYNYKIYYALGWLGDFERLLATSQIH